MDHESPRRSVRTAVDLRDAIAAAMADAAALALNAGNAEAIDLGAPINRVMLAVDEYTDLTGMRWTTDNPTPTRMLNADQQCTHTPDGDRRCLLDTGHPNGHITRTRGTDPCTADNGQAPFNTSRCARDTGHTGPHTTYAGKDF